MHVDVEIPFKFITKIRFLQHILSHCKNGIKFSLCFQYETISHTGTFYSTHTQHNCKSKICSMYSRCTMCMKCNLNDTIKKEMMYDCHLESDTCMSMKTYKISATKYCNFLFFVLFILFIYVLVFVLDAFCLTFNSCYRCIDIQQVQTTQISRFANKISYFQ